jgi:hypothetical protein
MVISNGRRMTEKKGKVEKVGEVKASEIMNSEEFYLTEAEEFQKDLKAKSFLKAEVKLAIARQRGIDPVIIALFQSALDEAKKHEAKNKSK